MNLVNWTPFTGSDNRLDRLFERLNRWPSVSAEGQLTDLDWRPSADIKETKKHYVIKAELPEVEREDVKVSVDNGMLTISGERRFEQEDESETQHRIESMYGHFSRSFALPTDADENGISAKCRNGVLKVLIPKTAEEQTRSKTIEVA